ncbi:MAG: hypothetical protein CML33_09410 [Rhodobacteraceae bacterium]|nr:hypothetical protein [Paracoccaceae bacterium]
MINENTEFPFDEIRDSNGDYFETITQAMVQTGLGSNHIWSVTCDDHEKDDWQVFITGPKHHIVNLLGYVVTREPHDGDTYYIEEVSFS